MIYGDWRLLVLLASLAAVLCEQVPISGQFCSTTTVFDQNASPMPTSSPSSWTAIKGFKPPQVPLDVQGYSLAPEGLQLEQVHVYVRHGLSPVSRHYLSNTAHSAHTTVFISSYYQANAHLWVSDWQTRRPTFLRTGSCAIPRTVSKQRFRASWAARVLKSYLNYMNGTALIANASMRHCIRERLLRGRMGPSSKENGV